MNNYSSVKLDFDLQYDFVYNLMNGLRASQPNILINCVDGETVAANKRYLGVFSSLLRNICMEFPEQDQVSVYVSYKKIHVDMMMEYLKTGELRSHEVGSLTEVISLMQCLGVGQQDTEIIEPLRQRDELQEIVSISQDKTEFNILKEQLLDKLDIIETEDKISGREEESNLIPLQTNSYKFICQHVKCEKVFKNKQALKQHSIVHSSARPFECKECGLCFGTKGILSNHMGIHNPTKCDYCPKKFAQKSWLKSHIKYYHLNQK